MTELRLNAVHHDGEGPPALILHGALGSRSYWDDNIHALQQVCQPIVLELWGHGRSPSPTDPAAYDPSGYVEQFELIRNEIETDRIWLIGQSMGAALMMHYALSKPEVTIGLVITNSSSAFADPSVWQERNRSMVQQRADDVEREGVEVLRDSWINPGRSKRISAPVRGRLAAEFSEHDVAGISGSFRYTNYSLPLGEGLTRISVPTLLTNGTDEERFQSLLPRVRLVPDIEIVELDASHAVNAHDPRGWNAAASRFITRHS